MQPMEREAKYDAYSPVASLAIRPAPWFTLGPLSSSGLVPDGTPTSFPVHPPAAVPYLILYASLPCPHLRVAHFSNKTSGSIVSQTNGRRYQRLPFLSLTIRHRQIRLLSIYAALV